MLIVACLMILSGCSTNVRLTQPIQATADPAITCPRRKALSTGISITGLVKRYASLGDDYDKRAMRQRSLADWVTRVQQ